MSGQQLARAGTEEGRCNVQRREEGARRSAADEWCFVEFGTSERGGG